MLNFLKDSIIVTSMFNELILIITSYAGNLPLSQIENSNHSTDILQLQLYSVNFFFQWSFAQKQMEWCFSILKKIWIKSELKAYSSHI